MMTKRGFTLIEMSIVLIIIGLIIGGVLVSTSMISASKVTKQIAQLQKFDSAVGSFRSEYKYLPGDAPQFGGNGDGAIDYQGNYPTTHGVDSYACEISNFWNELDPDNYQAAGLSPCVAGSTDMNTAGVTARAITTGITKNVPTSIIGRPGSFIVAIGKVIPGDFQADLTTPINYYAILDPTQIQSNIYCSSRYAFATTTSANSAVKPADMNALDVKTDDGDPTSGNVRAGGINTACGASGLIYEGYTTPTCYNAGTHQYLTTDSYLCTPMIAIGTQTGS